MRIECMLSDMSAVDSCSAGMAHMQPRPKAHLNVPVMGSDIVCETSYLKSDYFASHAAWLSE